MAFLRLFVCLLREVQCQSYCQVLFPAKFFKLSIQPQENATFNYISVDICSGYFDRLTNSDLFVKKISNALRQNDDSKFRNTRKLTPFVLRGANIVVKCEKRSAGMFVKSATVKKIPWLKACSKRRAIAGFHCHAIKIKIENHSLNEVKKLTRYRP